MLIQKGMHLVWAFLGTMLHNQATRIVSNFVRVSGAGVSAANGVFFRQSPEVIPDMFKAVCVKQKWDPVDTWASLTNLKTSWFLKDDGAYIYFNTGDSKWWIDGPDGLGLYIAKGDESSDLNDPPRQGWDVLSNEYKPLPHVVLENDEL